MFKNALFIKLVVFICCKQIIGYPINKYNIRTMSKSKLTRSRSKVIAGVCAGLAEWLGWDIAMVRILYLFVSILSAGFPGTLVYIILWIIMPDDAQY